MDVANDSYHTVWKGIDRYSPAAMGAQRRHLAQKGWDWKLPEGDDEKADGKVLAEVLGMCVLGGGLEPIGRGKSRGEGLEGRATPHRVEQTLRSICHPCSDPVLTLLWGMGLSQAREDTSWYISVPSHPQPAALRKSWPGVLLMHKCLSKLGSVGPPGAPSS